MIGINRVNAFVVENLDGKAAFDGVVAVKHGRAAGCLGLGEVQDRPQRHALPFGGAAAALDAVMPGDLHARGKGGQGQR